MLTNNFYKALADEMLVTKVNISKIISTGGTQNTNTDVDSYKNVYPFRVDKCQGDFAPIYDQTNGSYNRIGLIIGSDGTPPTLDDYKLKNQITTGYSYQLSKPTSNESIAESKKFILSLTVTNTSTNDLTVRELGFIKTCAYVGILLDRIVFDTPVVIKSGATKTFEYRLNMPQP